jgi:hypothetical protein
MHSFQVRIIYLHMVMETKRLFKVYFHYIIKTLFRDVQKQMLPDPTIVDELDALPRYERWWGLLKIRPVRKITSRLLSFPVCIETRLQSHGMDRQLAMGYHLWRTCFMARTLVPECFPARFE